MKNLPTYIESAVVTLLAPHVAGIDGRTLEAALAIVASKKGVTLKEVAAIAGVTLRSAQVWVHDGKLKPVARRGNKKLYDPASLALVKPKGD
jgi:transposase